MPRWRTSGLLALAVALCGACGAGTVDGEAGAADAAPPSGAADDPDEGAAGGDEHPGAVEMELAVPGDAAWTDTGVEVARGDLVWLEATGTIFLNDTTEVGPAGHAPDEHDQYNVVPCADHASLIAGIGEPPSPVPQGDVGWLLVPRSGLLAFGPNDSDFDNNKGAFTVHLRAPIAVEVIDERSAAVPADAGWVDTGVDVTTDDLLAISADGAVDDNTSDEIVRDATGIPGSAGHDFNRVVCGNHAALVGKIGNDGAPFYVGADLSRLAPATGRLFLAINDSDTANNGGKLNASILVARAP
ncbi:MAG TPA: hypothetical protein VMZ28_05275 [Kofleriaceae bacterium]|nr:hypothetical protein [Kofleriaceae bacterium]